jgi:hypothetical protein
MARFTKSEAGAKARQAAEPRKKPEPATTTPEQAAKQPDTVNSPDDDGA